MFHSAEWLISFEEKESNSLPTLYLISFLNEHYHIVTDLPALCNNYSLENSRSHAPLTYSFANFLHIDTILEILTHISLMGKTNQNPNSYFYSKSKKMLSFSMQKFIWIYIYCWSVKRSHDIEFKFYFTPYENHSITCESSISPQCRKKRLILLTELS